MKLRDQSLAIKRKKEKDWTEKINKTSAPGSQALNALYLAEKVIPFSIILKSGSTLKYS